MKTFKSGAKRQETDGKGRYDLLSPQAIRRLALVFEEGSAKYGDRNWEKGLPMENLLNHALMHIFAYMQGDKSEDHLGHAFWNIGAMIHFEEIGKMKEKDNDKKNAREENEKGETWPRYCPK